METARTVTRYTSIVNKETERKYFLKNHRKKRPNSKGTFKRQDAPKYYEKSSTFHYQSVIITTAGKEEKLTVVKSI